MALTARAAAVGCLLLALAASAAGAGSHSHAPAPAPAPATDCFTVAASLADCLNYVNQGSNDSRPSKTCCGEVKTAIASPAAVDCLCSLAGSKDLPLPIDMKRVLALPGACGASNSVFSKCPNVAGAPIEAPTPSAGGSSSGGATASPPHAAAAVSSPMTATTLVAAVAAPLLAYCYLF